MEYKLSFSKLFVRGTVLLFIIMGFMAWIKKDNPAKNLNPKKEGKLQKLPRQILEKKKNFLEVKEPKTSNVSPVNNRLEKKSSSVASPVRKDSIYRFFTRGTDKFDFIETIKYTSRVSWLKARPAWIADYASHYNTSRHFIARSLNKKEDYDSQKVCIADQFNVFKVDYFLEFQLVANLATCTMDFYCIHGSDRKKEFVKTYKISVGRPDEHSSSGYLTPLGKFTLGEKIAVYRSGVFNFFQNQRTEMIQVFGTRWLPFDKEIGECTDGARGYGLHGLPFRVSENGDLVEEIELQGTQTSDGCLRLKKSDIEELFSIVITKPTTIEIINESQCHGDTEHQENIIVKNADKLS